MPIVITYDIPSKHVEFKKAIIQIGSKDQITDPNCTILYFYFPKTTLYHPIKSAITARDEAKIVATNVGTALERCVTTNWDGWAGICGVPFN